MIVSELLGNRTQQTRLWSAVIIITVLGAAVFFGLTSSKSLLLLLLLSAVATLLLLRQPAAGLVLLVFAAFMIRFDIRTGTEVALNPASLVIPALFLLWLLDMVRKKDQSLVRSRTFLPLFLLLAVGIGSLLIGNATWDPFVPRPTNFLLVQLAQLGIFFLSAAAYFLAANMVKEEVWLRYVVLAILIFGGLLSVVYMLPGARVFIDQKATSAFNRAPFWLLLTAVAGGQLFFNKSLNIWQRLLLGLILVSVAYYTLVLYREVISFWIGSVVAFGILIWLRFPRLRWPLVTILVILLAAGILFPTVYEFAGGDAEWRMSGVSRIDLSRRVLEVTMHNPITGLGPASYRVYASVKPLIWRGGQRTWVGAVVSSHNNYIDMFSHVGIIGLGIFIWFMVEVALLAQRLRKRFVAGFASGYVNGALAAWAGTMVIMLFADWFLPFVYNIGFVGLQASVLLWLLFGGLVALDQLPEERHQIS